MVNPEIPRQDDSEIRLGQEFTLFNPSRTVRIHRTDGSGREHSSPLVLRPMYLPRFHVEINALWRPSEDIGITPFRKDTSYPIDEGDEGLQLDTLTIPTEQREDIKEEVEEENPFPLHLKVSLGRSVNEIARVYATNEKTVKDFFKLLCLQLQFPDKSTYEGRVSGQIQDSGIEGSIQPVIKYFYPKEPLEVQNNTYGHLLHLPDDEDKLSAIRAKFLLLSETP